MEFDDEHEDFEDRGPSRSARKREAEALQRLGRQLVELPAQRLASIPLDERLAEAVATARGISAHGGRRRQLQLIGKLMRQQDVEPIRAALERLEQGSATAAAEQHRVERWRERLLAEGDVALSEFLKAHPDADTQQLRQLIRNAQREHAAGKPPKSARELFRVIRRLLGYS